MDFDFSLDLFDFTPFSDTPTDLFSNVSRTFMESTTETSNSRRTFGPSDGKRKTVKQLRKVATIRYLHREKKGKNCLLQLNITRE